MENSMWKKGLVLGIIVLFVGASVVPSTGMEEKSTIGRSILYVGGSGPGNYTTIQAAINDANNGDTVFVYNGTYYENVIINKDSLQLLGENKTNTIIDGNNSGHGIAIPIPSNYINISNFTVRNANGSGIFFYDPISGRNCKNNKISDCIVFNSYINNDWKSGFGIHLGGHDAHMEDNTIINCEIYDNDASGILTYSSAYGQVTDNKILNCKIYNNGFQGWWAGGVIKGRNCSYRK